MILRPLSTSRSISEFDEQTEPPNGPVARLRRTYRAGTRWSGLLGAALLSTVAISAGAGITATPAQAAASYYTGDSGIGTVNCTQTSGSFNELCNDPKQACRGKIFAGWWGQMVDYKTFPEYNADGSYKWYTCIIHRQIFSSHRFNTVHVFTICNGAISNTTDCSNVDPKNHGRPEESCAFAGSGKLRNFVGNPINAATGNKYEEVVDFATAGPDVLELRRFYNSRDLKFGPTFGTGWRSNFDHRVRESADATAAFLERANGQEFKFVKSGGLWVKPGGNADVDYALTQSGGTYTVVTPDETTEEYNSSGQLTTITRPNGYEQTLTYSGGLLAIVTDSHGRTINFAFHGVLPAVWRITAPDGRFYKYAYFVQEQVLGEVVLPDATPGSEADNPRIFYRYDNPNFPSHLTRFWDEKGVAYATWTYDGEGRATSSQHVGGADLTTLTYNGNGTTTVENALTKQQIFSFTTTQGAKKVTQIAGQASSNCAATDTFYAYDANGYLDSFTDREGNVTTYVNNSRGLPTSITEAFGTALARTTTITWHGTYPLPTEIVAPELTTTFTHDSDGNILTRTEEDTTSHTVPYITDGETRTWTYTYTVDGQLDTADGPLAGAGDTTDYDYDSAGFVTKVTNALGQITDITSVNGMGQPLSITDPNGVVTDFAYDKRSRLETVTVDPLGAAALTSFVYDNVGQITRMVLPNGTALNYVYNNARRRTEISNDTGEKIVFTFNALGNVTQEETKDAALVLTKTLTRTFDELGRTLTHVGAGAQTTTYGYDKNDLLKTVTDPRSNVTTNTFDALNRLVTVTDALTNDADYGFDSAGNLDTVTDQNGFATAFVHNGFGEAIRRDSPDTGITDFEYDAAGNVTKQTDARGVVTNFTYDNLYRVTAKSFPASTGENVTYTYDDVTGGNKGKGRLTKIEDESGSTAYFFDVLGNIVEETRIIGATTYVTDYTYDDAGNLTQMVYPSGRIVDYARDSEGRVTGVTTKADALSPVVTVASNITYLPFGPISSIDFDNGLTTTLTYDQDYRLTDLDTTDGITPVQDLAYTHGNLSGDAGNIRVIDDNLDITRDQSFAYDAVYRLTEADGVYGAIDYVYDAAGNRTSRVITTGSTVTETLTYALASNRLLTVADGATTRTLGYTANGHVTTDTRGLGFDYLFNNADRLATLKENALTVATYSHNDIGERVVKDLGGGAVTHYMFDLGGTLIAESDALGAVAREYIQIGGLPVAIVDGANLRFVHPDHLGAPQKITDGAKAVVWDAVFTPFGEQDQITGALTANWRFPGQYHDAEAALAYNYMRTYDPALGRYLQSDPIGLAGGLNTYSYVGGNPLRYVDPTGEIICGGACIGAAVVGGIALWNFYDTGKDIVDTARTFLDKCSTRNERLAAVGILALGIIDPTPGNLSKKGLKAARGISVDDALDKANDFFKKGVPVKSVDGESGVQFIQSFTESGQKITKRAGIDVNPNSTHVKKQGSHLNLQTQINGKPVTKGPLADPHIPIDPSTIRPGDF